MSFPSLLTIKASSNASPARLPSCEKGIATANGSSTSQDVSLTAFVCDSATRSTDTAPPCARGVMRTTTDGSKSSSAIAVRGSGRSWSPSSPTGAWPAQ